MLSVELKEINKSYAQEILNGNDRVTRRSVFENFSDKKISSNFYGRTVFQLVQEDIKKSSKVEILLVAITYISFLAIAICASFALNNPSLGAFFAIAGIVVPLLVMCERITKLENDYLEEELDEGGVQKELDEVYASILQEHENSSKRITEHDSILALLGSNQEKSAS